MSKLSRQSEKGFSLIELLLVVVIIGILAAIAVPLLMRAKVAAENRSAYSLLTTIRSAQTQFYARHRRFGRLDELQQYNNATWGGENQSATGFSRGKFNYQLLSPTTDDGLRASFMMTATRSDSFGQYLYTLDESGYIDGDDTVR